MCFAAIPAMLLFATVASGPAGGAATTVTGRQGDRTVKFEGGLGTYYEGLVVALLGDCRTENPGKVTKEQWDKALKGNYLRVRFAKPRKFAVVGDTGEVEADEIVVPISSSQSPDWVYVRSGDGYRAFAKYTYIICSFIQENLKSLANR